MDRYQKIEKNGGGNLGEGTYGVVYKAKDRQTEEIVALKVRQSVRIGFLCVDGIDSMVMLSSSNHLALLPRVDCVIYKRAREKRGWCWLWFVSVFCF